MKLGLIGLGAMGRPMGERLLAAGHELTVWARRADAMQPLLAAGAVAAASPAALAAAAEVVLTMVTRDEDVEALVFGAHGLVGGLARDAVLIDASTVSPGYARALAERLGARGVHVLDAPVSGGPAGAAAGSLSIMVGGDAAILARVEPVLSVLGTRIVYIGPNGAGQVAKTCNQMVMLATMQGVAEGLALAERAGVDLAAVRSALQGGSAASRVLDVFGQRMIDRHYANGVESRLHDKDFGLIVDEARRLDLSVPLTALIAAQLAALQADGRGHDDTASLIELLRRGAA